MIPQVIYLILVGFSLAIHITRHGEPRDDYHAGLYIIDLAITLGLLYMGGFFDKLFL